jgi:quercetin dioxygenase-like cupin family protein
MLFAVSVVVFSAATVVAGTERRPGPVTEPVPGLRQTVLQRFDVPGTRYETAIMRVEFPADHESPRHAHPGPEGSYVLSGEVTFHFDGQQPRTYRAGESLEVPAYAVHSAKAGAAGFVLINTFVLEKGKPLVIPAVDVPAFALQ